MLLASAPVGLSSPWFDKIESNQYNAFRVQCSTRKYCYMSVSKPSHGRASSLPATDRFKVWFRCFFGTLSGCVSVFGSTPGDLVFECLRLFCRPMSGTRPSRLEGLRVKLTSAPASF